MVSSLFLTFNPRQPWILLKKTEFLLGKLMGGTTHDLSYLHRRARTGNKFDLNENCSFSNPNHLRVWQSKSGKFLRRTHWEGEGVTRGRGNGNGSRVRRTLLPGNDGDPSQSMLKGLHNFQSLGISPPSSSESDNDHLKYIGHVLESQSQLRGEPCLQASILDSLIGIQDIVFSYKWKWIIKLISIFLFELLTAIFRMFKAILRDENKQKLEDATSKVKSTATGLKKQYGPEVEKNVAKSKAVIARELPKLKDKLERDVPVMRKNLNEFSDRLDIEMKKAHTPADKRRTFYMMTGHLVQSNKIVLGGVVALLLYFVYCVLRFIYGIFFCP